MFVYTASYYHHHHHHHHHHPRSLPRNTPNSQNKLQQVMDPFAILQRARSFTSVIRTTRPGLTSEELETVALCTVVAASELKAVGGEGCI